MDIHTAFSQLKKENSQLKNDIRKIQMQLEYEKQKICLNMKIFRYLI